MKAFRCQVTANSACETHISCLGKAGSLQQLLESRCVSGGNCSDDVMYESKYACVPSLYLPIINSFLLQACMQTLCVIAFHVNVHGGILVD